MSGVTLTAHQVTLVLLVLGLLMGATALAGLAVAVRRLRVPAAVLAVVCAIAWLVVDRDLEGPVLLAFPGGHGLVLADLLVLPAALVVLVVALDEVSRRP